MSESNVCQRCQGPLPASHYLVQMDAPPPMAEAVRLSICDHCYRSFKAWAARHGKGARSGRSGGSGGRHEPVVPVVRAPREEPAASPEYAPRPEAVAISDRIQLPEPVSGRGRRDGSRSSHRPRHSESVSIAGEAEDEGPRYVIVVGVVVALFILNAIVVFLVARR